MLSVRYVGPLTEGVTVESLGATVLPGETLEVADDAVALNLLEQVGVWEAVDPEAAQAAADAAAAARAAAEAEAAEAVDVAEASVPEPVAEQIDGVDETPKDGE